MPKTILITGAGGRIGSLLRTALAQTSTVRSVSRKPIPGVESIVTDITNMEALVEACQGVDSVIHLAANASPHAPWDSVLHDNIDGTYTIIEAAARAGVKQFIFASSNHAVGYYDQEHAPGIYETGEPTLDHLVPVRPDGYYGVSKAFGEALGRYYADERGLHFISLRIGYYSTEETPPTVGRGEPLERMRTIWISPRDMVQLVEKCLEAEHVKFDIFYGISNNVPHYYDLEHVKAVIGYVPQDGSIGTTV